MNQTYAAWILALLVAASGAVVAVDTARLVQQDHAAETRISEHVFRTVDEDANVVCYVGVVQEGAGISCLARSATRLQPAQDSLVTVRQPNGSYEVGTVATVAGTAPRTAGSVALYVRADGDWHLLDLDEDGTTTGRDLVPVGANGTWRRDDVVLSNASEVLASPGDYQLGVVVAAGAVEPNGSLAPRLPPEALDAAEPASATVPLVVTAPFESESLVFVDVGGEVAVEDGEVTVRGLAPGADELLAVAVDRRGEFAAESVDVDDDAFDTDLALVGPDGSPLAEGTTVGIVLSAGRDGRVGNGVVRGEFDADLDTLVRHLRERRAAVPLSQAQVVEILESESVDEAGSDDLAIVDTFRITDARTTIDAVYPAGATVRTGVRPVPVGEQMVVRGRTNRKPGDNEMLVDLVAAASGQRVSTAETDEWGQAGVWQVRVPTEGLPPGSYVVEAADGDDSDVVRVDLRPVNGTRST